MMTDTSQDFNAHKSDVAKCLAGATAHYWVVVTASVTSDVLVSASMLCI